MNITLTPTASKKILTYIGNNPVMLADIYDDICIGLAMQESLIGERNSITHTLSTTQDVEKYFASMA